MRLRQFLLPALTLLVLLFIPGVACADPLVIDSGFITLGGVFPPGRGTFRSVSYNFGGNGFSTQGGEGDGSVQRGLVSCAFGPCVPGTLINAGSTPSLQGFAVTHVGGSTYSPSFLFDSMLAITGPQIVIPDSTLETITLQTTFTLSGTLNVFDPTAPSPLVFSTMITGQGIATLTLSRFTLNGVTGYMLHTIRYDFQPAAVPEPTTLLLLGTALAGLAARKRRTQAKR